MIWRWNRKKDAQSAAQTAAQSAAKPASDATAVHAAILRGIDALERNRADSGLDRVPLTMYESEGTPTSGRWIEGSETNYYPSELLDEDEKRLVRMEKSYTVISLVSAKPFGLVSYGAPGVELYERTRIRPMLPKLKPESNLFYVSKGGTYTGEQLKQLCGTLAESGWTPDAINMHVDAAIGKYRMQTRELMRQAGVEKSIKRLDSAHGLSGIDLLLFRIRMARLDNTLDWADQHLHLSDAGRQALVEKLQYGEQIAKRYYSPQGAS